MAARGVAGEGASHVVGSSARASLSDLYGSSGRTGAAERETAHVSARAEPTPGRVSVLRGFCFFFRLLQRCTGFPRRVWGPSCRETSGLCGGLLVAEPGAASAGCALAFLGSESGQGGGCGGGGGRGARPRSGSSADSGPGEGAGAAAPRRGGSAAPAFREWAASSRRLPALLPPIPFPAFDLTRRPRGSGGPRWTFLALFLSRVVGFVEIGAPGPAGAGAASEPRSSRALAGGRRGAGRGLRARRGAAGKGEEETGRRAGGGGGGSIEERPRRPAAFRVVRRLPTPWPWLR
ncbi:spidroin-1 [Oryctolagus cuniculus]|uniref:spidroin-1 n=1 Tax=Oryctolagus cuniculus TaxID=9986 RepID=UPI0038796D5F